MFRYYAVAVLLGLLTSSALQSDAVADDIDKLQGKWEMVSHVSDGELDEARTGAVRIVAGNEFVIKKNDRVMRAAHLEIHETKQPKWIDITFTRGPEAGKVRRGIYVIAGDTHQICYGKLNGERPTQFVSTRGSGHRLVVFRRIGATVSEDGGADHHHAEIGEVLFENGYAKVSKVRLEPGQSIPRHYGGYRLIYSLNDYVITWSEDRKNRGKKHWKKGQLHFHRPGEHSVVNSGAKAAEWIVFSSKASPPSKVSDDSPALLEVAPNHASELFDNEFFQVQHVQLGPGESIARHTGGPRLIYSLRDYKVRYRDLGEPKEKTFEMGECHWHEAGPHELQNIGAGTIEFLVIYYKP
jgi:uncharacterized protein (TIGR03067 family)